MPIETVMIVLAVAVSLGLFLVFRRRNEPRYYGQTFEDRDKRDVPEEAPEEASVPMTFGKRIAAIAFLSVWISIWSAGVYAALTTRIGLSYGDEGYIFLTIWLAGGIPAWFFVAWTLLRLIRGDEIDIQFDGDGDGDGGGD